MIKFEGLNSLVSQGYNVHKYKLLNSVEDLVEFSKSNKLFSVRFDSDELMYDLPFFIYDGVFKNRNVEVSAEYICKLAHEKGCKLLCSDGFKYDSIQICNFVYRLDAYGDYILELSFKSVPLRNMYDGSTIVIKGNLYSSTYETISRTEDIKYLSKTLVNKLLDFMFITGVVNKWFECTLYPKSVGVLNSPIVYWQVF